jgi:hypothetical protein
MYLKDIRFGAQKNKIPEVIKIAAPMIANIGNFGEILGKNNSLKLIKIATQIPKHKNTKAVIKPALAFTTISSLETPKMSSYPEKLNLVDSPLIVAAGENNTNTAIIARIAQANPKNFNVFFIKSPSKKHFCF